MKMNSELYVKYLIQNNNDKSRMIHVNTDLQLGALRYTHTKYCTDFHGVRVYISPKLILLIIILFLEFVLFGLVKFL